MAGKKAIEIFRYAIIGFILLIWCFPLYWLIGTSVKPDYNIFTIPPQWIPSPLSMEWFKRVLFLEKMLQYLKNSAIIGTVSAIISVSLGSLAAYSFTNFKFRGNGPLSLSILLVRMVPRIVIIIPIFVIFKRFGLLDTYTGLILLYTGYTLPFSVWMMRGFFMEVPSDMEEAARIDGCSRIGAFWRVILPLVSPGLLATLLFVFVLCWSEFPLALVITRTRHSQTIPIAASQYIADRGVEWGAMSAVGTIAVVPIIFFVIAVQKYLIRGLTFGAVKG